MGPPGPSSGGGGGRGTLRVAVPAMPCVAALMVAVPPCCATACPAALIEATAGFDDDHETLAVMFWVLPSAYFPVAVYCCVCPMGTDAEAGVTAIEVSAGGVQAELKTTSTQ